MRSAILVGVAAILLASDDASAQPPQELDLVQAVAASLAASPAVREGEAALRRSEIQSRLALSPFLPKLAVEASRVEKAPQDRNLSGNNLFGTASLNLYNGGLDLTSRRIQRVELAQAQQKLAVIRGQVTREVVRRFAELLYLEEAIRIKNEALTLNKAQMQIAKRKAQGGITSSADVLEFEFRENALNTEVELLQHERNGASRNLAVAMGSEPISDLKARGTLSPSLISGVFDSKESSEFLTSEALVDPKSELQVADLGYSSALATWLPRADIGARYGKMEFADPEVVGVPGWRLEFRITIPIFSGMETLSARQLASARQREAETKLRRTDLELKTTLADREEKIRVLENLIRLQHENHARAEKYYEATLVEYKRGIKNSPDLSGATERLFDSRLKANGLVKDLLMAKIGLLETVKFELQ